MPDFTSTDHPAQEKSRERGCPVLPLSMLNSSGGMPAMHLHQPFQLRYAGAAFGTALELGLQRKQVCAKLKVLDDFVFRHIQAIADNPAPVVMAGRRCAHRRQRPAPQVI